MHPKKRIRYLLPDFIIISLFVCFLIFAASRQGLNFDAAYNMLSYQSLFDGNGFVYTYSGTSDPFDPVISTGPELYLPTFLLWKLSGTTDYALASYVLALYFALFLFFYRFCFLRQNRQGWLVMLLCLCLFLCKKSFFEGDLFMAPLGELLAAFLVFIGLFLLFHKKIITGFLLLGFALDTKTNILTPLLPTVALLIYGRYLLPLLRKKQYNRAAVKTIMLLVLSGLMLVPWLTYTKVVPALTLERNEYIELKNNQSLRSKHMIKWGFGQMLPIVRNPGKDTISKFAQDTGNKLKTLLRFYDNSALLACLFIISLVYFSFLALTIKSFLLYVFIFSGITAVWWVLCPGVGFYRYYVIADLLYLFGAVGLTAVLFKKHRTLSAMITIVMLLLLFLPQFSPGTINKSLDDTNLQQLRAMGQTLKDFDERQIFALGWFQAPELMLMTHKRFQNYYDTENLAQAKADFDSVYLIATQAAIIFSDLSDEQYAEMQLVADHGIAKLYKIP